MRHLYVSLLLLGLSVPAVANDRLPREDCSADFLARWQRNPEAALKSMPDPPCWMKTRTGPYVCYKEGCVRAHVYFDG